MKEVAAAEPLGLSPLRGQDPVRDQLRRDLSGNRLASAYLLAGGEGLGKRTAARGFAAEGLCREGRACGTCPSCVQFRSGQHPAYKEVAPTSERGALPSLKIEEVDQVLSEMALQAYGGSRRFILILDVHTGTTVGLNRLLKVIEEPPAGTTLILTAPSREAVLPTIASRCRTLVFRPLDKKTLELLAGPEGGSPWLSGSMRGLERDEETEEDLAALKACLSGNFSGPALSALFPPGVSSDRSRVLARLDLALLGLSDSLRALAAAGGEPRLPGLGGSQYKGSLRQALRLEEALLQARDAITANAGTGLAAEAFLIRAARIAAEER